MVEAVGVSACLYMVFLPHLVFRLLCDRTLYRSRVSMFGVAECHSIFDAKTALLPQRHLAEFKERLIRLIPA